MRDGGIEKLRTRVEDLNKTVGEMKTLISMRESKTDDLHEKVAKIYSCLIGDGDTEKPSVIVRLDRVEQIVSIVKWVCGTVVLLVVNAIFERFKH